MKDNELIKFVIIKIGNQKFGIPVKHIIDVLLPQKIYPIPLAPKEILGSINLRGKIVTALNIQLLLGIKDSSNFTKCIILEHGNELFSFMVDEIGEASSFTLGALVETPDNLGELWQEISLGIYSHADKDELMVVLDVDKLIELIFKKA